MIIANPLYDTVFKRLMENRRVARFFVETIIGEQVVEIAMVPQEYTYYKKVHKKINKKEEDSNTNKENDWEILSLIRFDFVATICTATGEHKKVLIEIQKSGKPTDLVRFRTYLGEQYKRIDMVDVISGKIEKALPIVSIYLFGFKIPNIKATAIKVKRSYFDMISQTEIKQKSALIEALTHDGYFVQIPHIKGKPRSVLEKLLSVFEQQYFIDEKNILKEYEYLIDDENINELIEILRHTALNPKEKRCLEEEWWATQNEMEWEKEVVGMKKIIEDKNKALEYKDKALEDKDKALKDKDKLIAKVLKENEMLQQKLGLK